MTDAFLQFVVARGLLAREQWHTIRTRLRTVPEPIGMLAFQHGMLNSADIDRVLDAQRGDRRRFGELAVEMGLLTKTQIDALLWVQRCRSVFELAEALVLSGLVSPPAVLTCLGEFLTSWASCSAPCTAPAAKSEVSG